MLGLPWAWRTTSTGSRPNLLAQAVHTRATAGVESTKTPSISNSNARQRICIAIMIISLTKNARRNQGGLGIKSRGWKGSYLRFRITRNDADKIQSLCD